MALFEFEDGRLVPAQFGYPVAQDLGPDLVDAICQQVLQIVSRPLFPVTWRDMTGQDDEETPRLTALDVTGQIVSVEILKELDSETLITSLSRLAEVASISWSDLAAEYPSGPEGFRAGWAQFRDSMPPAVGPGPRLIMVAGDIDPSVRPALSVLATSGVEVHLMNLRQMSNGRLFLDVNAVGPRLYGHAPQLLASASTAPEIVAPVQEDVEEVDAGASVESDSETPTTRPTPKVAPHLRDVFTYPIDEEPPAPWHPASEEDEQDEAETADALDSTEAPEQGEASERHDAAEDAAQSAADEWAPVGEAEAQDEHEATEQDAGDDPAVRGGYPTTLAPLGVNLTGMVELALGAQGTHIPHGGPVHRPHLRSTSKELRMPTARTGVVTLDGGRTRGQDAQLGRIAVLDIGAPRHLTAPHQIRKEVHGENRDEGDDCPDLDSHTATVGVSAPVPAQEHSGFPAKYLGFRMSHCQ